MAKYRVVWTGVIELEASDPQKAIDIVKAEPKEILRESKFGAFADGVSYTEPKGKKA